jgi:hypothetical protein
MKLLGTDILFFLIILILLWFTNKQHDHIVYLEDTIKIQEQAISKQGFLIECQKLILSKDLNSPSHQNFFKYIYD